MNKVHLLGLSFLALVGLLGAVASNTGLDLYVILALVGLLVLQRLLLQGADQGLRGRLQVLLLLCFAAFAYVVWTRVQTILDSLH